MEAVFTSRIGGSQVRERVLGTLRDLVAAATSHRVDVDIMTFSFTDAQIASSLLDIGTACPNMTIRLIADWGQGSGTAGHQVARLAALGLPNLQVRYKVDQPYIWDPDAERLRWSYRASRGLLHHKTLAVAIDGQPSTLVCGSFNWTTKAVNSYENLLVFDVGDAESMDLQRAVAAEFRALWSDRRLTLAPAEAQAHYRAILEAYRQHPERTPVDIQALAAGEGPPVSHSDAAVGDLRQAIGHDARLAIAFSSRGAWDLEAANGFAPENRRRRFELHRVSGELSWVPLTLSTLALDVLARPRPGDTLSVAMYGMSARVPEYGALLDAARRGVRLQVLLDRVVGSAMLRRLAAARAKESLPIELRAGRHVMHQKTVIHRESATVLTGTANFSTDASARHAEHRILIRNHPGLAARFEEDFDTIWARLQPFECC